MGNMMYLSKTAFDVGMNHITAKGGEKYEIQ